VTNVEDTTHSEPKQPVPDPFGASPPNQLSTQQQPGPVPAQQPTTTTTTTVTTTNATPKPSTSTDIPIGDKHVADEKDKGSLSTSAGTRTHSGLKGNKSSSEGALSASDATATSPTRHEKSPKSQAKQSFLNKLVRVLIPCVVPSSRTHDIELPGDAQPTVTVPAVKEKHGTVGSVREASSPTQNGRTTEPAQPSNQTSEPSTSSATTPPQSTSRSDTAPPPPEDVSQAGLAAANDLTVTPTPAKTLLPVVDLEGVTSGGVQPPGSRGDDVVHTRTHSQDSGDESDATTTFTEEDDVDEINALDDMEDEEERLIMNGGVGIPIGPVSVLLSLSLLASHRSTAGWCTTSPVASPCTSACGP
jgi:carboxy-terminal domain RNA polymerase II polypeptide A small phosphatase